MIRASRSLSSSARLPFGAVAGRPTIAERDLECFVAACARSIFEFDKSANNEEVGDDGVVVDGNVLRIANLRGEPLTDEAGRGGVFSFVETSSGTSSSIFSAAGPLRVLVRFSRTSSKFVIGAGFVLTFFTGGAVVEIRLATGLDAAVLDVVSGRLAAPVVESVVVLKSRSTDVAGFVAPDPAFMDDMRRETPLSVGLFLTGSLTSDFVDAASDPASEDFAREIVGRVGGLFIVLAPSALAAIVDDRVAELAAEPVEDFVGPVARLVVDFKVDVGLPSLAPATERSEAGVPILAPFAFSIVYQTSHALHLTPYVFASLV